MATSEHQNEADAPGDFEPPDLAKYAGGVTGFTMDIQCVYAQRRRPARRRRIGSRGLYRAGFARLPGGALAAAPCTAVDRPHYVTELHRSDDGGHSWSRVAQGPPGKDPTLLALAGGTLLLLTQDLSRPLDALRCWRSCDGGRNWTECDLPNVDKPWPTRAFYQRPDGVVRLFVSSGSWAWQEKSDLDRSVARIIESDDDGATWHRAARIETWPHAAPFCAEASIASLQDGRLLMVTRAPGDFPSRDGAPPDMPERIEHTKAYDHLVMTRSVDGGRTWSAPWQILERGNVHAHLLCLADGRLLVTYASVHLPFGVFAAVSRDEGRSFDGDARMLLSHSLWQWGGWPTTLQRDDGSLVTCYAKTAYWDDRSQNDPRDLACEFVHWQL